MPAIAAVGATERATRRRPKIAPAVASLLAVFGALIVIAPPTTFAGSAVCEQYPDLPQCQPGGGADPSGNPGAEGGAGGGAGGGGAGSGGGDRGASPAIPGPGGSAAGGDPVAAGDAGGASAPAAELPFTGYPLTPWVLFLLIVLGAGLAIRAYIAARGRLALRGAGPGS